MKRKPDILQIHDLTVAYQSKPVLWDIDLSIPEGVLSAVIGPNGAGKTTLLKTALGLVKPVSGNIIFPEECTVGYVPQSESIDWDFPVTVLDVVMMGRYGRLGWFRRPGKEDKKAAYEVLEKMGMEVYASRQISQLSGGQQQRVFLARALVQNADLYFMDEPFKGVDVKTEKVIVQQLRELKREGKTVIVVHHDLQTVPEYFDWVILIHKKIVADGPVKQVFTEENLKQAYHSTTALEKAV